MKRKSGYKTLIVSILALSLLPVFNLRAETKEEVQVPIYFRFNSEVYDPAVFSNQEAMRSIFQTIESLGWDRIESIEITGYSSPDGVYEVNNNIMFSWDDIKPSFGFLITSIRSFHESMKKRKRI